MNSWKSTLESACAPPLRMFIIGTGSVKRLVAVQRADVPVERHAAAAAASARSAAIETPSSALAPSRLLVGVPSSAIIAASSAALIELAAAERRGDLAVDVGDRLAHALAAVARLVAVAQFERLALAGRRARRHRRAAERAARRASRPLPPSDCRASPESRARCTLRDLHESLLRFRIPELSNLPNSTRRRRGGRRPLRTAAPPR